MLVNCAFDHVVIVVSELGAAVEQFRAAGFAVTPGGRHDVLPTENALVAFPGGDYLELLAMREPAARAELGRLRASDAWESHLHGASAVARRFLPRLAGVDGVGDACFCVGRLDRFARESRARGFALTGPVAMERARRDTSALAWSLLLPADDGLPFLIEDRTPRAARVPGGPDATTHGNGATGVAGLLVRTPEPARLSLAYADLFGASPRVGSGGATSLALGGVTIRITAGAPAGACGVELSGVGALPASLEALGVHALPEGSA
nr:VOC family protein [Candidatus Acidoferrales bacterium]